MKNLGILHILFLLIAMLVCKCVNAQDFLVTVKGDTIYGEIKPLNFGPEKKVQVRTADKKKTIYSMFQVSHYSLEKESYYPVKGPSGYSFMKLLKPGYLSLYGFQPENQVNYDGRYLLKLDGRGTEVPNLSFKKTLVNFLKDCDKVATRIENGELTKKDLEQIIDEYNGCIAANTVQRVPSSGSVASKKKVDYWETLAEKVSAHENFDGKEDALEMINEIKTKLSKSEKVPNFLIQGLKETLTVPALQEDLQNALNEIDQ